MTTHPTPDALSTQAENELICEKLLGWKPRKCFSPYEGRFMGYDFLDGRRETTAPSFTTWAAAGLILEAWTAAGNDYDLEGTVTDLGTKISARLRQIKGISYVGDFAGHKDTAPLAIRSAALAFIRSLS